MHFITKLVGTFFFSGLFPIAPATFASLVFVLAYALIPGGHWLAHPLVALATLVVSVPVATRLEKAYGHDAGRIVIDEVVGMQAVLIWSAPSAWGLVAAFFGFRFFDIFKPPPAGWSQRLPRGYGVVCDDVIAGIYTRISLVLLSSFIPALGRFW